MSLELGYMYVIQLNYGYYVRQISIKYFNSTPKKDYVNLAFTKQLMQL